MKPARQKKSLTENLFKSNLNSFETHVQRLCEATKKLSGNDKERIKQELVSLHFEKAFGPDAEYGDDSDMEMEEMLETHPHEAYFDVLDDPKRLGDFIKTHYGDTLDDIRAFVDSVKHASRKWSQEGYKVEPVNVKAAHLKELDNFLTLNASQDRVVNKYVGDTLEAINDGPKTSYFNGFLEAFHSHHRNQTTINYEVPMLGRTMFRHIVREILDQEPETRNEAMYMLLYNIQRLKNSTTLHMQGDEKTNNFFQSLCDPDKLNKQGESWMPLYGGYVFTHAHTVKALGNMVHQATGELAASDRARDLQFAFGEMMAFAATYAAGYKSGSVKSLHISKHPFSSYKAPAFDDFTPDAGLLASLAELPTTSQKEAQHAAAKALAPFLKELVKVQVMIGEPDDGEKRLQAMSNVGSYLAALHAKLKEAGHDEWFAPIMAQAMESTRQMAERAQPKLDIQGNATARGFLELAKSISAEERRMPQPDTATLGRIRELADGLDAMGNIEFEETLDTIIDGMGRQIRGVEVKVAEMEKPLGLDIKIPKLNAMLTEPGGNATSRILDSVKSRQGSRRQR